MARVPERLAWAISPARRLQSVLCAMDTPDRSAAVSIITHASRRAGWLKGWAALNRAKEAGTEEELADKKSMRIADPSGFSRNAFLAKLVSGQSRTRPC